MIVWPSITSVLTFLVATVGRSRRGDVSPHRRQASLPEEELLRKHRTVILRGEISDASAEEVIAKLLFLEHEDSTAPVRLYVDSPGGRVTSSLAIRDAIDELKAPVHTHCLGSAAGGALVVLAHGARGHRSASPSAALAMVPLYAPEGGRVVADEVAKLDGIVNGMLASDTRRPSVVVATDVSQSRRFDAAQARAYGLIDSIEE